MKIKHLKNQFRSFTLASGRSLYLYPMAENIEVSEQDFYLTAKLQRYMKDSKALAVQEEDKNEVVSGAIISSTGSKKKKLKKQKSLED